MARIFHCLVTLSSPLFYSLAFRAANYIDVSFIVDSFELLGYAPNHPDIPIVLHFHHHCTAAQL